MQPVRIGIMGGPVTVAFRRSGKEWICTALEFDIVGTGGSREAAFEQMRELVNDYLFEIIGSDDNVRLLNPADGREWAIQDKGYYHVAIALADRPVEAISAKTFGPSVVDRLRHLRNDIRGLDLIPAFT